jgi:hypothetical protein
VDKTQWLENELAGKVVNILLIGQVVLCDLLLGKQGMHSISQFNNGHETKQESPKGGWDGCETFPIVK